MLATMSQREARQAAAAKYRPEKVRLLLVAEAPPGDESRYFYFEDVTRASPSAAQILAAIRGSGAASRCKWLRWCHTTARWTCRCLLGSRTQLRNAATRSAASCSPLAVQPVPSNSGVCPFVACT
jgi:hypothetical protein